MQKLRQLHLQLIKQKPGFFYSRQFYEDFSLELRHMGIVGPRGVGKTTFLLNYIRQHYQEDNSALYVSADHLYFIEHSLFEVAESFFNQDNGQLLCIDEIHKYPNWNQELKNIYDFLPQLNVIFSGSSSLDLIEGTYDLSRRAILKPMHGLSFREYLEIKLDQKFPILSLKQVVEQSDKYTKQLMDTPKLLGYFKTYLKKGYYFSSQEIEKTSTFYQTLVNMVNKSIFEDLASFYSLKTSHLQSLKKIIYFYATSQPGELNVNRLAKSLQHDHKTVADYLQKLRATGLLRFLLINKQGHALVRNAEKIFLDNTNLLYAVNSIVGQKVRSGVAREMFLIKSLQNAGEIVTYDKTADCSCQNYVFEVGGKSKKKKQLAVRKNAYLVLDDILVAHDKKIPLWLFGFLY